MAENIRREMWLHRLFLVGVWLKGLMGGIQTIGGSVLLLVDSHWITAAAVYITHPELAEDPHDALSLFLRHSATSLASGSKTFAAVYLFVHGLIKLLLVAGLMRRKLWSYPASLWVLGAFVAYQLNRYVATRSPWLLILTAIDVAVIALVWHEWRHRVKHGFEPAVAATP
ncbi:DUF2127 domain-containing protein [Cognatilysobacter lacus]|uniref:DUF2127 domain-containing protein n=1 Tax=Cognatilysobacter lacus TaxID=1643323 RepID=A0A5D8Z7T1_9GAMM|nr:DUF2127 domain-containing protein [Lysobacter lacus]TZF90143.1 DUF2127 domain-containing protein [Lysobacter lacus]